MLRIFTQFSLKHECEKSQYNVVCQSLPYPDLGQGDEKGIEYKAERQICNKRY